MEKKCKSHRVVKLDLHQYFVDKPYRLMRRKYERDSLNIKIVARN